MTGHAHPKSSDPSATDSETSNDAGTTRARASDWPYRLVAIALGVRLFVLILSFGTNDVFYWSKIATDVTDIGIMETYRTLPELNHPPVAALVITVLYQAAVFLDLPFAWFLKAPVIATDFLAALLIWRIVLERSGKEDARRSIVGFLLCPAVIVLSAYHGNTDSILATLLLGGAWAAHKGRWGWAGLLLGAAVNVKLLAIAGVVAVVFSVRGVRDFWRLALGASVTFVPFLLILIADHEAVIDKVFRYTPSAEPWGIPWMLTGFNPDYVEGPNALAWWYLDHGTFIVSTALVVTAIAARILRLDAIRAAFAGTATYLVFTPSIGVQHLAIVLPLAFAIPARNRWRLPTAASVFLVTVYAVFLVNLVPLSSNHGRWPLPVIILGFLVWMAALAALVSVLLRRSGDARKGTNGEESEGPEHASMPAGQDDRPPNRGRHVRGQAVP
ncbi:MAG: glycosyltransferase 87 family protein [Acidimicrobiia bacterium]